MFAQAAEEAFSYSDYLVWGAGEVCCRGALEPVGEDVGVPAGPSLPHAELSITNSSEAKRQ